MFLSASISSPTGRCALEEVLEEVSSPAYRQSGPVSSLHSAKLKRFVRTQILGSRRPEEWRWPLGCFLARRSIKGPSQKMAKKEMKKLLPKHQEHIDPSRKLRAHKRRTRHKFKPRPE